MAVGQILLRHPQFLLCRFQILLDGEQFALALLAVDLHQHLTGDTCR